MTDVIRQTILNLQMTLTTELISSLQTRLERVFERSLGPRDKKKKKIGLDDAGVMVIEDSHTFLVLDCSLQTIPRESLPMLQGQSVSRIPSLEFLVDRLRLVEMERGEDKDKKLDRVRMDGRKSTTC